MFTKHQKPYNYSIFLLKQLKIKYPIKTYGKIELSRNYQPIHPKKIYLHGNI